MTRLRVANVVRRVQRALDVLVYALDRPADIYARVEAKAAAELVETERLRACESARLREISERPIVPTSEPPPPTIPAVIGCSICDALLEASAQFNREQCRQNFAWCRPPFITTPDGGHCGFHAAVLGEDHSLQGYST